MFGKVGKVNATRHDAEAPELCTASAGFDQSLQTAVPVNNGVMIWPRFS